MHTHVLKIQLMNMWKMELRQGVVFNDVCLCQGPAASWLVASVALWREG